VPRSGNILNFVATKDGEAATEALASPNSHWTHILLYVYYRQRSTLNERLKICHMEVQDLSELLSDKKRYLPITAANLQWSHLYVTGHYDFFPADAVRGSKKDRNGEPPIEIFLDGLNEIIRTDIGRDAKTGKPRGFLRDRKSVRRFYAYHGVVPGQNLALERLSERRYHLSVEQPILNGRSPTAAEFFAGIGLVRLALERQGWKVVFANDIDPDKAEMYRKNWSKDDHLVVGDIHKLDASNVSSCDLFTASFPCNDLLARTKILDGT
jgi:hypothetical protein